MMSEKITPKDLFGNRSSSGENSAATKATVINHVQDLRHDELRRLGALDEYGNLTEVGCKMEAFANESAEHARMLVEAQQYGAEVQAQVSAIVAMQKSPDITRYKSKKHPCEERWRGFISEEHKDSDLINQLEVFVAAQGLSKEELQGHDLRANALHTIENKLEELKNIQGLDSEALVTPTKEQREQIVKCIIAAGANKLWRLNVGGTMMNYSLDVFLSPKMRRTRPTDAVYTNADGEIRMKGRRSSVGLGRLVVATPRDIPGVDVKILEDVTNIPSLDVVKEVAPQLFTGEDKGFVISEDGILKRHIQHVLDDGLVKLDDEYIAAEPNEETVNYLIGCIAEKRKYNSHIIDEANRVLRGVRAKTGIGVPEYGKNDVLQHVAESMDGVCLTDETGRLRTVEDIANDIPALKANQIVPQMMLDDVNRLYPDEWHEHAVYYRSQKDGKTSPYYTDVTVDNIDTLPPEAFTLPNGETVLCKWEGEFITAEEMREKAKEERAKQEAIERARQLEREFYESKKLLIDRLSIRSKLTARLEEERLRLQRRVNYIYYTDKDAKEKLNELSGLVDEWEEKCRA